MLTFIPIVISVIYPPALVAALIAGLFVTASGRLTYESNRKYVLWLGRKVSERYGSLPDELVRKACHEGGLAAIEPLPTREVPSWYTPRRLKPVAEAFLKYPGEVVAYLVNQSLPRMSSASVGSRGPTDGLAGDLMMTFERMYILNPALGDAAATMLVLAAMTSPTLRQARVTLHEVGTASVGSRSLQAEECTGPDHRMNTAVKEVLTKLDPAMARLLIRRGN
jgi:hypothetical protein